MTIPNVAGADKRYLLQPNPAVWSLIPDADRYPVLNGYNYDAWNDEYPFSATFLFDPNGVFLRESEYFQERYFAYLPSVSYWNDNVSPNFLGDDAYDFPTAKANLLNILYYFREWYAFLETEIVKYNEIILERFNYIEWYINNNLGEFPKSFEVLSGFLTFAQNAEDKIQDLIAENEANISVAEGLSETGNYTYNSIKFLLPNPVPDTFGSVIAQIRATYNYNFQLFRYDPFATKTRYDAYWLRYTCLGKPGIYQVPSYEDGSPASLRDMLITDAPVIGMVNRPQRQTNLINFTTYLKWSHNLDPRDITGLDQRDAISGRRSVEQETIGILAAPFRDDKKSPLMVSAWLADLDLYTIGYINPNSKVYRTNMDNLPIPDRKSEEFDVLVYGIPSLPNCQTVIPGTEFHYLTGEDERELRYFNPGLEFEKRKEVFASSEFDEIHLGPFDPQVCFFREPNKPEEGIPEFPKLPGFADTYGNTGRVQSLPLFAEKRVTDQTIYPKKLLYEGRSLKDATPTEEETFKSSTTAPFVHTTARALGAFTGSSYRRGWSVGTPSQGTQTLLALPDLGEPDPLDGSFFPAQNFPTNIPARWVNSGNTFYEATVTSSLLYSPPEGNQFYYGEDRLSSHPAWVFKITLDVEGIYKETIFYPTIDYNNPFYAFYVTAREYHRKSTATWIIATTGEPHHWQPTRTLRFSSLSGNYDIDGTTLFPSGEYAPLEDPDDPNSRKPNKIWSNGTYISDYYSAVGDPVLVLNTEYVDSSNNTNFPPPADPIPYSVPDADNVYYLQEKDSSPRIFNYAFFNNSLPLGRFLSSFPEDDVEESQAEDYYEFRAKLFNSWPDLVYFGDTVNQGDGSQISVPDIPFIELYNVLFTTSFPLRA
jgi:hypothetical protein